VLDSVGSPAAAWPAAWILGVLGRQFAMLAQEMRSPGVSAAVFTELADYEQELGILSYDRRVFTIDPALFRRWNAALTGGSRTAAGVRPQAPAVPAGTTGLWQFDEGRGVIAADSSGRAAPLVLTGGVRWTRGVRGSALSISAPGQMAQTARPVIDSGRSFSVSAWVSPGRSGQSGSAVSEGGAHGSSFSLGIQTTLRGPRLRPGEISSGVRAAAQRTWWTFAAPSGSPCSVFPCGVQANMHYDDGRLPPRVGSWHNVTGVYDAGSLTISVFVDGVPEDVEHVNGLTPATGPLTVGAGVGVYAPADMFIGTIDELRTYQRALNPAEIWQLYAAERVRGR
jgi:hypothetical protein